MQRFSIRRPMPFAEFLESKPNYSMHIANMFFLCVVVLHLFRERIWFSYDTMFSMRTLNGISAVSHFFVDRYFNCTPWSRGPILSKVINNFGDQNSDSNAKQSPKSCKLISGKYEGIWPRWLESNLSILYHAAHLILGVSNTKSLPPSHLPRAHRFLAAVSRGHSSGIYAPCFSRSNHRFVGHGLLQTWRISRTPKTDTTKSEIYRRGITARRGYIDPFDT